METNHWKILGMGLTAALWLALTVAAWCHPPAEHSLTERRPLAQAPELTADSVSEGSFMSDFESYAQDQFPFRERFRSLKAGVHRNIFGRLDNNGIYIHNGQATKLEYPLNTDSVSHALSVFDRIHSRFLPDSRVFLSVIPDKGYYLDRELGYPRLDDDELVERLRQGMPYASYVNLFDTLDASAYYATDLHWRQEALTGTANRLCQALGIPEPGELTLRKLDTPFYGVYYGQAALPLAPDTVYTVHSPLLDSCRVYHYETGKYSGIYDWDKFSGNDPYQGFLSGSVSLLRIDNPQAATDRELIVFRDSFASSLAPLLVQGYRSITLVDIRYIHSSLLDRFLDFSGKDVLFLYSITVLNNGMSLQ